MAMRQVFAVVGAVVGYIVGGPAGAQYGWMIGSAVGNEWDPPQVNGPVIGEIAQQTSQEGGPRPIVFGQSPPMAGNIIALSEHRKIKRRKRQGKGGPVVVTESVLRTYAIAVCEGPITRFLRVWRNGELIWDGRDQVDTEYGAPDPAEDEAAFARWVLRKLTNNLLFEQRVDFFLGTYDQEPSPFLEEIYGVGTTPAFRGTAYMMIQDDDVTDFRGAVPQYLFQVERCEGEFLTSRVYPIEDIEAMGIGGELERDSPTTDAGDEPLDVGGSLLSGTLRDLLAEYGDGVPEAMTVGGALLSGTHVDVLLDYPDAVPEAMTVGGALLSGTHADKLIEYVDYPPEAMNVGGSLQSGSLT